MKSSVSDVTERAFPKTNEVIKIHAKDKKVFFVNKEVAMMSEHLSKVLTEPAFMESGNGEI